MKNSLSHAVWECKYHVVWVPKSRRKIIYGKLRQEVGTILRRLCEYKGIKIIEAKACVDHIRMSFRTKQATGWAGGSDYTPDHREMP